MARIPRRPGSPRVGPPGRGTFEVALSAARQRQHGSKPRRGAWVGAAGAVGAGAVLVIINLSTLEQTKLPARGYRLALAAAHVLGVWAIWAGLALLVAGSLALSALLRSRHAFASRKAALGSAVLVAISGLGLAAAATFNKAKPHKAEARSGAAGASSSGVTSSSTTANGANDASPRSQTSGHRSHRDRRAGPRSSATRNGGVRRGNTSNVDYVPPAASPPISTTNAPSRSGTRPRRTPRAVPAVPAPALPPASTAANPGAVTITKTVTQGGMTGNATATEGGSATSGSLTNSNSESFTYTSH
jgi:hypothetical protein